MNSGNWIGTTNVDHNADPSQHLVGKYSIGGYSFLRGRKEITPLKWKEETFLSYINGK